MNTDTPTTDQWETYCDECYYHMWRLRRKTERGWHDGFHVHTGEEAKGLCDLLNNLERERDELRRWTSVNGVIELQHERDEARETIAATLRAWQTAQEKIIAATKERDEARAETIRWMSIAEGRGRTEDEPDTQAELAEAYAKLDRILKLTIHDDTFWAIEEIARISGGESDCSVCGGCFMIPGSEENDDVMNTPCPKCNSPSEDTGKAMAKLIRQRDEARGQRDRLAAALINCMPFISGEGCGEYSDAKLALQSLTTNELSNQ